MSTHLTIAVSKGRIFEEAIPLFVASDIVLLEAPETTRKLILETSQAGVRIIIVRPADVPTYVEYGAADLGIAGKDVLLEYGGNALYEPVDLNIARCRMVVAESAGGSTNSGRKRVATKYVNIARRYFADQGKQVDMIKLYGSMELAPTLGLADQIVDLVDTGYTLKANGLVEVAQVMEVSARLIVNKGAMKMRYAEIKPIIEKLTNSVGRP